MIISNRLESKPSEVDLKVNDVDGVEHDSDEFWKA